MSKFLKLFVPAVAGAGTMFTIAYSLAGGFVVQMPADDQFQMWKAPPAPEPVAVVEPAPEPAPAPAAAAPVVAMAGAGAVHGLGRAALPEEIAAWDLDILPDGTGLPVGSGDVWTGDEVFAEHCAACHGDFAEGIDNWPKLAGGWGTLADEDPLKTVGSYWPYLSTTFDYIRRSMPFGNAQSLSDDDVYAITAYILYSNNMVEDDFVLSNETFFDVAMPNAEGFIVDDRATAEAHFWTAEPCMENCKDSVEITMRATVLDVTPDEDGAEDVAEAPAAPVPGEGAVFGLGRAALPVEVAAWDLDILPDGTGLPVGSGDVWTGDEVFAEHCAACHGDFAEGIDNWPKLAGGWGTLADEDPLKTVGSYWPYLSTTFDYIRRSMPFGNAQSLSDDDVYAITAYILYSNNMVEDDFVLSNETFFDVAMPNAEGFIVDDRATAEAHFWTDAPCMENCKDSVEITMRATVLDVTPEEDTPEPAAEPVVVAAVAEATEAPVVEAAAGGLDPALVAAGEKAFGKCKSCHQVGEGAKHRSGPQLTGIVGAPIGAQDGFKYSKTMAAAGAEGRVWSTDELVGFLMDPKGYMKGTKMSFRGVKEASDAEALATYLQSMAE